MCKLKYYDIAEGVTAFSTTRHGGISKGNYGELNINPYCGDEPEAIAENRRRLCSLLHITDNHLLMPHQVHGTQNLLVTQNVLQGANSVLEGFDSISTNIRNVCVGVSTADCIPILLYDKKQNVVAAVHAGWRGTVQRIVALTIQGMRKNYSTLPENLVAAIGPGISLKNFEVGQEVYDKFEGAGFDMSLIARKFSCGITTNTEKWHIDLPLCNQMQLEHSGVLPENIMQSGICTYENNEDFFSARRLGLESGRIYSGIIMK